MAAAPYTKWASPQERVAGIRQGALHRCLADCIRPSEVGRVVKTAAGPAGALDTTLKMILVSSLLTGVPIGIAAHHINRKVKEDREKERELKARIGFYNDASGDLEAGLAGGGAYLA
jgi:hypothetical protein